jgi:LacI family transcriptional regulator
MLVEDISYPFFASIARGIEEAAHKMGYRIIYSSTENDTEITKQLIEIYRARQVDGYIIAPPPGIEKEIQSLMSENLPVVLFDRYFPDLLTDNVVVDNYKATYSAIEHLFSNGFRNVAFITLPSKQIQMQERLTAYTNVIAEKEGISYIKTIGFHSEHAAAVSAIESFISDNIKLDSIFFATSYLADAGLEAIKNLGMSIPDQLGVIVFDDYRLFRLFTPPITAISQPIKELSETIIKLLLDKLSSSQKVSGHQTIEISTELIIRESSSSSERHL